MSVKKVEAVPVSVSGRSVTIQISNQTQNYTLTNPKVWQSSGNTHIEPTALIKPMESKVCSFIKSRGTATGCVGVLTYELQSDIYQDILAIMFSVPQDYNLYSNWSAVGIYGHGRDCDKDLFDEMYNKKEKRFVRRKAGSEMEYAGQFLNVKASMLDVPTSILTVELFNKA